MEKLGEKVGHNHKFMKRIKRPFNFENLMKVINIILSENLLNNEFMEYYSSQNPSDVNYLEKYANCMINDNREGFLTLHGEDGVNDTIPAVILDIAHRISMVANAGSIFNYTLCEAMEVIDTREDVIRQKMLIIVKDYLKHVFGDLESLNIDVIFEKAYPKLLDTLRSLNDADDLKGSIGRFHEHFDFMQTPVRRKFIEVKEYINDETYYGLMRVEILGNF